MADCPHSSENAVFVSIADWGDVVTIRIDKREFPVHRGLISFHSDYFEAQFSGRWGNVNVIDFTESDETSFEAFVSFIYSRQIAPLPGRTVRSRDDMKPIAKLTTGNHPAKEEPTEIDSTKDEHLSKEDEQEKRAKKRILELCKMYALGSFLLCASFQSAVLDAICGILTNEWINPWASLNYAYENTPAKCGLRRFLADWFAKSDDNMSKHIDEKRNILPRDFIVDVSIILYQIVHCGRDRKPASREYWRKVIKCTYHDHDGEKQARSDGEA